MRQIFISTNYMAICDFFKPIINTVDHCSKFESLSFDKKSRRLFVVAEKSKKKKKVVVADKSSSVDRPLV